MNGVEEFLDAVGFEWRGRERRSLAFQLREQSVHGIGDGGGKWKRRDGGLVMARAVFYCVTCATFCCY